MKTYLLIFSMFVIIAMCVGCYEKSNDEINNVDYDVSVNNSENTAFPNTYLPQIKIDDTIYYLAGKELYNIIIPENEILGKVETVVPLTQVPTENKQANFDIEDAPYADYENGIVILWNNVWTLFTKDLVE